MQGHLDKGKKYFCLYIWTHGEKTPPRIKKKIIILIITSGIVHSQFVLWKVSATINEKHQYEN